ncbi:hypothetical protein GGR21_001359 [Dysgonomonas hofstadii]|uniref:DUF3078 domain-containing protein n=1 Tax=Dysgonomonas hofstadii TaxID=637886 RepID=A0A840CJD4_9BACT|nr:DUF3078 domain-containing protein [Dysgonomonas hofstadii]MBB4035466.1 hypothetical protein [Dysgonomonas hofstadii]
MKTKHHNLILIYILLLIPTGLFAQKIKEKDKTGENEEKAWELRGISGLNVSQTSLSSWQMGGNSSLSGTAHLNASLIHKSKGWLWQNDLALEYGLTKNGTSTSQKSGDNIDFSSKLGYSSNNKWYYTGTIDFKSQFYKGKLHPKEGKYTSKFMSPGYVNTSIGIEYRPNKNYSIYLSPIAEKMTFVLDDYLSNHGYYGVRNGDKLRVETGIYIKSRAEKELMENVKLITKIDIFTPYDKSFGNFDIDWNLTINMKINKLLSANLNTTLKYDDNVKYIDKNGDSKGAKVQFKETLGLGISYNF